MEVFEEYLAQIANPDHRARTEEVLAWVSKKFPDLVPKVAWNQPMFTDHDTFIIGFSVSKQHLAVAPERSGIIHFATEIVQAGYDHTNQLLRIKWKSPVDYALLERMIEFNIMDKADCTTFWRK
ncbi:iron chaperone [Paenibacillus sp. N1-5-1-14]|uniref:iron chaperone n=1 Tax=Paenibacillus radicibacter TaxID=2972488 RepID=UPI002158CA5F|nr:iron chaperone [Paenibacillus radicibacter]MCR8642015.1 iron chaperone [Paenibacillus radicibacter]